MSAADYSRALARAAAAQIAELSGFDAAHDSALDILADLLQRYLANVCAGAHEYAELAGRTQANSLDALLALEDLGVTPEELNTFAGLVVKSGGVPFAHAAARYPVLQQAPSAPTFLDRHEPHPAHIPGHLPAFPDAHTYQHTPAFQGHETDAQRQRQAVLAGKQRAEAALVKLHQRLATAANGGANGGEGAAGKGAGAAAANANPFLAPPVVVAADDASLPGPPGAGAGGGAAEAGGGGGGGGGGGAGDELDFDAGAARHVFRAVLGQAARDQQAPGQPGADAMETDGGGAGGLVLWALDAPPAGAGAGADAAAAAGRQQELLNLQLHDPGKAASVLGAAARAPPPDAYLERAEAMMAAEGAAGGRQRKSAYARGNADLQRADELLRAGYAAGGGGAGGGGGGGGGGLDDDDFVM
ncbi:hypothetical protein Rsub_13123 [Raphidocelis subcapitata]|uniref:Transcription initiation factor TFIID subunit 8 n=1 Tax=Raphidocelis subcapitata TaxID=307507 RepID=A0A2V0PQ99_9CHLO|nr:hypothetical protein Rsub_13123 [Raphidocelis subcapitata]|eukprot:GBG00364.1 hypothetical protein Rsub_13123 [Raphidocelis subcapitata]